MKPITEERQQELIEYIKSVLSAHVQRGGDSDEEDVFKIALASLTAKPIGYCTRYDVEALQRGDAAGVSHAPNCHHPVYTAPLVPVIKLPDRDDMPVWVEDDDSFFAWYEIEINRLNGLEQS